MDIDSKKIESQLIQITSEDLNLEKFKAIEQINKDIQDLLVCNQILNNLVTEQGEVINSIEDSIEKTKNETKNANQELEQALKYQISNRLGIVGAVVGGVISFGLTSGLSLGITCLSTTSGCIVGYYYGSKN